MDDRLYVLKRIDINKVNKAIKREVLLEVSIMRKLKHPHIIKYYTSFLEDEFLYILMEYADGGDLHRLMKHRRRCGAFVKEDDVWMFAYQMSLALEYLHSQNIVHRDIKCLNVFLTKHKIVKVDWFIVSFCIDRRPWHFPSSRAGLFRANSCGDASLPCTRISARLSL